MIRRHASLGSTNDEAMRLALHENAPAFDAVSADSQSAGRGRLGRAWVSPPGGLYASVVLRPRLAPESLCAVPLLAGVAAAEAVRGVSGAPALVKWSNDILINGGKAAGLLCETGSLGGGGAPALVIAGLGANVNTAPQDLPARPLYPATSIAAECGRRCEPALILDAWIARLRHWLADAESWAGAGLPPALAARWAELDALFGKRVKAGGCEGMACGIDAQGRLLLRGDGGAAAPVIAGDAVSIS